MRKALHEAQDTPKEFLSRDEEAELARRWRDQQDRRARDRILAAYEKLAVSFATRYTRAGIPHDDLVQEAKMGMMAALDTFEPERGHRFSTFARYHILSHLQVYVLENVAPVRIFNTAVTKSLLARYASLRHQHAQNGQLDEQARAAICAELGVDDNHLMRFEMAVAVPASIDAGAGEDSEGGVRGEVLVSTDNPAETTVAKLGREQAGAMLSAILQTLPARDADIIRRRHLSEPAATLDALSKELDISRERVRQIELRALGKIRQGMLERGISSVGDLFGTS